MPVNLAQYSEQDLLRYPIPDSLNIAVSDEQFEAFMALWKDECDKAQQKQDDKEADYDR